MKAAHHLQDLARSEEVDDHSCHTGGTQAAVGDTIAAWAGDAGGGWRVCFYGSQMCVIVCLCQRVWSALHAVRVGCMASQNHELKERAILSFGGEVQKVTNFEQPWRLAFCSAVVTSAEPNVSYHHGWPYAKPRRPSVPSTASSVDTVLPKLGKYRFRYCTLRGLCEYDMHIFIGNDLGSFLGRCLRPRDRQGIPSRWA